MHCKEIEKFRPHNISNSVIVVVTKAGLGHIILVIT